MNRFLFPVLLVLLTLSACSSPASAPSTETQEPQKVIVGYVTSWSDKIPDPTVVTHLNYAFGHVTDGFDSVRIDNVERLRQIVDLKQQSPELKVLVSIGGWGSGNFSEMASDSLTRRAFAQNCRVAVDEYGLDGIDIDWEYPTSSAAKISSSPLDKHNFTLLMQDIRQAIGTDRLLTFADYADTAFVDYPEVLPSVDFVNLMTYDLAEPPYHHSALLRSGITGRISVAEAIEHHLAAGVHQSKLVVGMPFYGHSCKGYDGEKAFGKMSHNYKECWDSVAQVPYLVDAQGKMVLAFENQQSLAIKCQYILDHQLRGAMYWCFDQDDEQLTLGRAVWENIYPTPNP